LKPGNVLVDAEGRVRVIDFGIAKQLDITGQTEGLLPLSAPYAAPELLTGTPPGPPVDVYGAAALLYELATGRPPIDLDGVPVALGISRVLESEPPRIADLRASTGLLAAAPIGLVEDLDAILARALRKEPADRYPTLDALAEDLRRALAGGVVTARSGDRAYRLRRALWRARWPIAASAAIFVALAGGFVATWMQKQEAVAARDAALAEEDRSEAVRQSLYLMLSDSVDTSGTDATSREVLDRTTRRIMAEFARNPAESARVLHALGEMHFYLGNYEAARDTLLPLVTSPSADIPPDTLAAARYDMAQALVQLGEIDAARPMLAMAQDYWRQDRVKWRARLIDSRLVEAQVLRATDPAGAVALLRSAMAEHDAMHGTRNRQAGVFRNNLGVNLLATGELDAARDAFRQAQAIWQATGLTESPDALNTANNLAAVETLAGRPEEAEPLFATAVRIRRQLFGGSGATAALLSNHGKVLLQLGRVDEALEQLREAVPMARQYAGEGSMGHIAALAGLADAQAANGDRAALATARQAVAATGLGRAPPPGRVMALISLARAEGLAGNR
ncbi:MAG: tetratricopeptide repeat protein, partial [Erythrobacter sp.]|nr:tetratricopeptide repeat protein [Erythrobacter sp.]